MEQHKTATATFTVTFEYGEDWGRPEDFALDIAEAIEKLGQLHDGYEEDFAVVKVEVKR
jgi:hypothetical protein